MDRVKDSYDDLPYISNPFGYSSPLRLEAIASLLHLDPCPTSSARVLEIGSSFGGNLIPFAVNNPNSTLVGIDLSRHHVVEGNKLIESIGVNNVTLHQCDIRYLDIDLGKFDYIICHGVYSWVPLDVRDAILRTIKSSLSDRGVAYISYNTYPGWKNRDILRDLMQFHASYERTLHGKLDAAKKGISFYADYLTHEFSRDLNLPRNYLAEKVKFEILGEKYDDYYVYHEYLEEFNDPVYLYQFVQHLNDHGLDYLSDSVLLTSINDGLGMSEFDGYIREHYKDRVDREQLFDFLLNRQFRHSIFTHKKNMKNVSVVDGVIQASDIRKFHFSGVFTIDEEGVLSSTGKRFDHCFKGVALALNRIFPNTASFFDIARELGVDPSNDTFLHKYLFDLVITGSINFFVNPVVSSGYTPRKTRLKPSYRQYVSYFANTRNPLIGLGDFANNVLLVNKEDANVMLEFDGLNTKEEIAKFVTNIISGDGVTLNKIDENGNKIEIKGGEDMSIFVSEYVDSIEHKMKAHCLIEVMR